MFRRMLRAIFRGIFKPNFLLWLYIVSCESSVRIILISPIHVRECKVLICYYSVPSLVRTTGWFGKFWSKHVRAVSVEIIITVHYYYYYCGPW